MPAAARVDDEHACEIHGGGVITQGCSTVRIGFQSSARAEDECMCVVPNAIAEGSATVMIGGMPAARVDDPTDHGGVITSGFSTVNIGTNAQIQVLLMAAALGLPFCEECQSKGLSGPSGEP